MKKVIVTSTNPVKINAVKIAFDKVFPKINFQFESAAIHSGVSDQPMSEDEAFKGAFNRVENASKNIKADYWIGLEGGIEESKQGMRAFAWMVVKSKKGLVGKARSASFILPDAVAEIIRRGKELGEADDIVFGIRNSKQKNGSVGILTKDLITREKLYSEALILALIPFVNQKLYN